MLAYADYEVLSIACIYLLNVLTASEYRFHPFCIIPVGTVNLLNI